MVLNDSLFSLSWLQTLDGFYLQFFFLLEREFFFLNKILFFICSAPVHEL